MDDKVAIATASSEAEAERLRLKLLDLGVPLAWTAYCELVGLWTVLVYSQDARGAYTRLKRC